MPVITNLEQFYDKEYLESERKKTPNLILSSNINALPANASTNRTQDELKVPMNLDSSAADVVKELKKKLDPVSSLCISGTDKRASSMRCTISSSMRNAMLVPEAQGVADELCLYLFKTHARAKMLAFRRLAGNEQPMRMLPLDYFSEYMSGTMVEHSVLTPTSAAQNISTNSSNPGM